MTSRTRSAAAETTTSRRELLPVFVLLALLVLLVLGASAQLFVEARSPAAAGELARAGITVERATVGLPLAIIRAAV